MTVGLLPWSPPFSARWCWGEGLSLLHIRRDEGAKTGSELEHLRAISFQPNEPLLRHELHAYVRLFTKRGLSAARPTRLARM